MSQHPLPLHSPIELVTDKYASRGVPRGTRGCILEIYGIKAYEVQFFDEQNKPLDWFAIAQGEARTIHTGAPPSKLGGN